MNQQDIRLSNVQATIANVAGGNVTNVVQSDPPMLVLQYANEAGGGALALRNVGGRTAIDIAYCFGGEGYDTDAGEGLVLEPGCSHLLTRTFVSTARQRSDLVGACISVTYNDVGGERYELVEPLGWTPERIDDNAIHAVYRFEPGCLDRWHSNRLAGVLWESAAYITDYVAFFPIGAARGSHRQVDTGIEVRSRADGDRLSAVLRVESGGRVVLSTIQSSIPPTKSLQLETVFQNCILFMLLIHRMYGRLSPNKEGVLEVELHNLDGATLPDYLLRGEPRLPASFSAAQRSSRAEIPLVLPACGNWVEWCAGICRTIFEDCFSAFPGTCLLAGHIPGGMYPDTISWSIPIDVMTEKVLSVLRFVHADDVL